MGGIQVSDKCDMEIEKKLTLNVLQPTLSGQMDRSQTFRPLTPWTFKRSSKTPPCGAMELPSRGAMLHVPRECQVVSTWRWTKRQSSEKKAKKKCPLLTPLLDVLNILLVIFEGRAGLDLV